MTYYVMVDIGLYVMVSMIQYSIHVCSLGLVNNLKLL